MQKGRKVTTGRSATGLRSGIAELGLGDPEPAILVSQRQDEVVDGQEMENAARQYEEVPDGVVERDGLTLKDSAERTGKSPPTSRAMPVGGRPGDLKGRQQATPCPDR